jgi:hypothetical protein
MCGAFSFSDSENPMKPSTGIAAIIATIVLVCSLAHAATPLPPAPAFGWCSDGSNSAGFFGVRGCPQPPPPPPPAAGRQLTAHIAYTPRGGVRYPGGLTEWAGIFGHAIATDAEMPWPGRSNSQPTIVDFVRGKYVSFHVHTGAAGSGPTYGWLTHTEYNYGPNVRFAWSRAIGDFSVAVLGATCADDQTSSGQNIGAYTTAVNPAPPLPPVFPAFCHLPPNSDVYLNIEYADDWTSGTCLIGSIVCPLGMANNFH